MLRLEKHGQEIGPKLVIAYVKQLNEERHLHAVRFGSTKPYFTESPEGGLQLYKDHISKEFDSSKITEPKYKNSTEAKLRIVKKIIYRMKTHTSELNAEFLLVAGWEDLCKVIEPIECIVAKIPSNGSIITPEGEDLFHLNSEANRFIGNLIADYLKSSSLLPYDCI